MIRLTRHLATGNEDCLIFENEQECKDNCITVIPLENADVGDYVKSDNGYYLPVLTKHKTKKIIKDKICWRVSILFPGGYEYKNVIYGDSMKFRRKVFKWSRDEVYNQNVGVKKLTARQQLMALYLSEGMDVYQAFDLTHSKYNSRDKREQAINTIILNPLFKEHLRGTGIMESLRRTVINQGMNSEWLAKKMKEIIEDKKESAPLRKMCLERAIDFNVMMFKEEIGEQTRKDKSEQENNNKVVSIDDVVKDKIFSKNA